MLENILLGFLNYAPLTGYDLKQIIDQSITHFWHAYHSQIYTTLRRLEDQGLVTSQVESGDDALKRRRYTVTDAGRAALKEWLDKPLTEMAPIKEALLVRLFFSAQRSREEVLNELRFQRVLHQQQLEFYQHIATKGFDHKTHHGVDLSEEAHFWQATLRFGLMYEEMYLRWLDDTITSLDDG